MAKCNGMKGFWNGLSKKSSRMRLVTQRKIEVILANLIIGKNLKNTPKRFLLND